MCVYCVFAVNPSLLANMHCKVISRRLVTAILSTDGGLSWQQSNAAIILIKFVVFGFSFFLNLKIGQ